jgi:Cd2+/Zn2+-exporting ATPase
MVALVLVLPPMIGWLDWRASFLRAMAVLVSASPCALAIATPAAVLSGIACAARAGVLIKGGLHLESLGRLRAIAFDKTGTITEGKPVVTGAWPTPGVDESELIAVAAALESHSTHPLARAVVRRAEELGIVSPPAEGVVSQAGAGLRGTIAREEAWIGRPEQLGLSSGLLPAPLQATLDRLAEEGQTGVAVGRAGRVLGVLGIADRARSDVATTLDRIRRLGIAELVMLTGDNPRVARATASAVGLTDFRAGLLPEDKLKAIEELTRRVGPTAMVGDGVNDAPALARAAVGIAMGAAGTDVALETADVALMADDLDALPFAVELGRRTRRVIRDNLILALGVVAVLVPLSVLGITGIGIAIVLHEGSTLAVVGNALRLLRHPR